jgi:hypothetical protein
VKRIAFVLLALSTTLMPAFAQTVSVRFDPPKHTGVWELPVYCDGSKLGSLQHGSFTAEMAPGKHACYAQDSRFGLTTLNVDSTGLAFQVVVSGGGIASRPSTSFIRTGGDKVVAANVQTTPRIRVFLGARSAGNAQVGTLRDQSMEMASDFAMACPAVQVTINETAADFTIQLNHIEAGMLVRDNQIAVYDKTGDLIGQREGSSIKKAVEAVCAMIGPA